MSELFRTGAAAVLMALLIPVLVLTVKGRLKETEIPPVLPAETAETVTEPVTEKRSWDAQQTVLLSVDGVQQELPLAEYLVGVLAGELPQGFEPAAIAAQAVAARTFTLRSMEQGKHGGYLCSDAACCQAWTPDVDDQWRAVLEDAIALTDGQVLCYEGELIEALFFSCSGGRTESAVAVWGGEVPYLVAVDSPGEEEAPRYSGEVRCSGADFRSIVMDAHPEAMLSGTPENWLGQVTYTDGGGVDAIEVGAVSIPGTQMRKLFGLNSTNFMLTFEGEKFVFRTLGFGHRVGMSQYGANAMAQDGATWQEILEHYYPGASLLAQS